MENYLYEETGGLGGRYVLVTKEHVYVSDGDVGLQSCNVGCLGCKIDSKFSVISSERDYIKGAVNTHFPDEPSPKIDYKTTWRAV